MKSVFMRYPGGLSKAVTFSYDDGKGEDLRLASLFEIFFDVDGVPYSVRPGEVLTIPKG